MYVLLFPRSVRIHMDGNIVYATIPHSIRASFSAKEKERKMMIIITIAYHMPAKRAPVECRSRSASTYLAYTIYTQCTVHKRPSNHLYKPEPVYVSISSELVASETISERSTKRTLNTRSHPLSSTHVFAFTPVVPPVPGKFKSAGSVLKL